MLLPGTGLLSAKLFDVVTKSSLTDRHEFVVHCYFREEIFLTLKRRTKVRGLASLVLLNKEASIERKKIPNAKKRTGLRRYPSERTTLRASAESIQYCCRNL